MCIPVQSAKKQMKDKDICQTPVYPKTFKPKIEFLLYGLVEILPAGVCNSWVAAQKFRR